MITALRCTVCIGGVLLIAGCNQRNGSSDTKHATVEQAVPAAQQAQNTPQIITESVVLLYSHETDAEGSVKMNEIASCAGVKFDGRWTPVGDQAVPMNRSSGVLGLAFEPGVQHHFTGKVCIPGPKLPYMEDATSNAAFKTILNKDEEYIAAHEGPVNFSGSATFASKDSVGKVFMVESDANSPLTLLVTRQGYRYHSGKGSIVTPDGHRYEFQ